MPETVGYLLISFIYFAIAWLHWAPAPPEDERANIDPNRSNDEE
jgi:hypothetical protein